MSRVFTYLRNKEWTDFSKSNSHYRKERYLTHSLTHTHTRVRTHAHAHTHTRARTYTRVPRRWPHHSPRAWVKVVTGFYHFVLHNAIQTSTNTETKIYCTPHWTLINLVTAVSEVFSSLTNMSSFQCYHFICKYYIVSGMQTHSKTDQTHLGHNWETLLSHSTLQTQKSDESSL